LRHHIVSVLICGPCRTAVAEVLVARMVYRIILTISLAEDRPLLVRIGARLIVPLNNRVTAGLDPAIVETFPAAQIEKFEVAGAETHNVPLLGGIGTRIVGILYNGCTVGRAAISVKDHATATGRADDLVMSSCAQRCCANFGRSCRCTKCIDCFDGVVVGCASCYRGVRIGRARNSGLVSRRAFSAAARTTINVKAKPGANISS